MWQYIIIWIVKVGSFLAWWKKSFLSVNHRQTSYFAAAKSEVFCLQFRGKPWWFPPKTPFIPKLETSCKNLFGNCITVARRLLICSQRTGSIFFWLLPKKLFGHNNTRKFRCEEHLAPQFSSKIAWRSQTAIFAMQKPRFWTRAAPTVLFALEKSF